jgi:hypothetical protein
MRRLSPAKVVAARMTDAPHAKFDAEARSSSRPANGADDIARF